MNKLDYKIECIRKEGIETWIGKITLLNQVIYKSSAMSANGIRNNLINFLRNLRSKPMNLLNFSTEFKSSIEIVVKDKVGNKVGVFYD